MNYKYLRKTLIMLDLEMFIYLPINYTELGLKNLIYLIDDYRGNKNKHHCLKDYLANKIPIDIPFLQISRSINWAFHASLIIRKVFLKTIETSDMLYEFIKYNQFSEDEEMVNLICKKCEQHSKDFTTEIRNSLLSLAENSLTSIFPYRRLLGLRLLAVIDKRIITQEMKLNVVFDNSQVVRNYSQRFIKDLRFNENEIESLFLRNTKKNLEPLFIYLRERPFGYEKITLLAVYKVESFISGDYGLEIYNYLRLLIICNYEATECYLTKIQNILLELQQLTKEHNRILKEVCYFHYTKRDSENLIKILLLVDDLGIILTIEKYLQEFSLDFPDDRIRKFIETLNYNDKWVRKSAGIGILFKSLSSNNKKLTLDIIIENIKQHINCDERQCNNKNMCNNCLYHNYSILLSIVEEFTITVELLELCIRGLGSSSWIVKNNSIRLYKIFYNKVESIELNHELRNCVKELLSREIKLYSQIDQNKTVFNDVIFSLILLINQYEAINSEESALFTSLERFGGFMRHAVLNKSNFKKNENLKTIFFLRENKIDKEIEHQLRPFLELQDYKTLKTWLLIFVSEDFDNKNDLKENLFGTFNFTFEKLIFEIIKLICEKNKDDQLIRELQGLKSTFYDLNYLLFILKEIKSK